MPFTTPEYPDIAAAILRDIANQRPDAAVGDDSDYACRARAVASAIEGLYQHQMWVARQILPDTADTEYLERWVSLVGVAPRKPAAAAGGTLTLSGAPGAEVPAGTQGVTSAGEAYATTEAAVIGAGGTASAPAVAAAPGAAGNAAAGTAVTLSAAPPGVQSAATLGGMTGGAAAETDAALLARLLARLRKPPQGGAAHDYQTWAMEVPGVTAAYVYPLRRGLMTVDVIVLAAGGLPAPSLVADVQALIDANRPVTADCLVLAPTAVPVAVTATLALSGTTLSAAQTAIQAALAAYFSTLRPGDTVYRTRLIALIADVAGVQDVTLSAPVANVATTVSEPTVQWPTLGAVTLS